VWLHFAKILKPRLVISTKNTDLEVVIWALKKVLSPGQTLVSASFPDSVLS
jgi:hypothetical protein